MLLGFLTFGFILLSLVLILLIFLQKGKGSMGLGSLGGGSQMLFGGSGGQDLFQKATWALLALLMASSLALSIMKSRSSHKYMGALGRQVPVQQEARR